MDMIKLLKKSDRKGAEVPVLLIDNSARDKIKKIIDYAKKHPTKKSDLLKIQKGKKPPVGDNTKHSLILSGHYRIVYSREHQIDGRFYHHLSISVPGGKYPSVPSVEMIAEEFGMGRNMQSWDGLWREGKAINVIKEISDEDNDL
jgi:hypothetical protein